MTAPLSDGARCHGHHSGLPLCLTAAFGAFVLAGCGGSGSSQVQDPSAAAIPASAPATPPPPSPTPVSLSVTHAGLILAQQLQLSATTGDASQVSWSISPGGGTVSPATSASGATVTYTAPAAAGVYTVTATSLGAAAQSASATIGVTDLTGVYTYHNDLARSGANDQEYLLTPANVNSAGFGKLFSCIADGAIYAQPLWVAGLTIAGARRNVVFVATQHDSVFAFDADQNPCVQLWTASLLDTAHGAQPGETTVISAGPDRVVGDGAGAITPETGITGTPVIDPATRTLYVVSKSMVSSGDLIAFYQRLHALDLVTGQEKPGSPVTIAATAPGTGDGGTTVTFDAHLQLQRPGLALVNGTVYITWASHEDAPPYYGWVIGYTYDGTSFTQTAVLNLTPDAGYGGIWMSGAAPASANGLLYLMTGNGTFDAAGTGPLPNDDYGDSLVELTPDLKVSQYFAPSDEVMGVPQDLDFGAGGVVLMDLPATSPVAHLIAGGSKDSNLYVLNRDALGGLGDQNAWQKLNIGGPVLSSPAFWHNQLYIGGIQAPLVAYQLDPASAQLSSATSSMIGTLPYFARTPSVSGAHGTGGIVWALDNSQVCTINTQFGAPVEDPCGPAVLEAYDATNLQRELWSSATATADTAGIAVRNAVPMIANGKVYIGTRGNNTGGPLGSTSAAGELDVYGLK